MAALTVDFRKHSGPTPADDMAAQIITDCGNFTLDLKLHGFCASPLFLKTLGPWFPNEMQHLLSSEKKTLDHWATLQLFFSLAQIRSFWQCFCFFSWRRLRVVTLDALTPTSVHSLWSSPKCLNWLCLKVFSHFQIFICHVHNYTEYNQQWNVSQVRSMDSAIIRNTNTR